MIDLSSQPFSDSLECLKTGMILSDLRMRWAVARARSVGLNPADHYRGLYVSDGKIDKLLSMGFGEHLWSFSSEEEPLDWSEWQQAIEALEANWNMRRLKAREAGTFMSLDHLVSAFGLTDAETQALLLLLAIELDTRYEQFFSYLQDDVMKKRPSIDLILNLLSDSFAEKLKLRGLFRENGRLIDNRLVLRLPSSGNATQDTLLSQFVRLAPNVVEYLIGEPLLDDALVQSAQLQPIPENPEPPKRVPKEVVDKIVNIYQTYNHQPVFAFSGIYGVGKLEAATQFATRLGQPVIVVNLLKLKNSEIGLEEGTRLLKRDGLLFDAMLYLNEWDSTLENDHPDPNLLDHLLSYPNSVFVVSHRSWQVQNNNQQRSVFPIDFPTPDYPRRVAIWKHHLPNSDFDLGSLANHFQFTPGQIEDVIQTAVDMANWEETDLNPDHLFASSRLHSNQKLSALATKIPPRYRWDDIVLPPDTLSQLKEMVDMVRYRPTIYGQWGFDRKMSLGKGLNALFAGESGTGKTMSADIIAGELGLDLYKIDLSMLVSKYIGETEKNLERIFTEAETSNAILFFDEADSIFGKRSEVKDSHDRYANIEVSYLLQRMEGYDGIVILATNLRANLDKAFTRRLHFVIEFPFPKAKDRERILRVNVPRETPLAEGVSFEVLGERFDLAGGNLRNIILSAASLAAREGKEVEMKHLFHATRREYQKTGRLVDEELFRLKKNGNSILNGH